MPLPSPPAHPERLVYLGTPAVAVTPLLALLEAGFDVPLVISGPDRRRGRGSKLSWSPVKEAAIAHDVSVSEHIEDCLDVGADLGVVVAYGRIVRRPILEALPMINLHFSLLPRWRGAAPVERAILAGDPVTGVSLMALAVELDAGDVYAQRTVPIGDRDTLDSLRSRLVSIGAELLVDELNSGLGQPKPQIGEVTYAAKLTTDDLRLRFESSTEQLDRQIRLGRAWCEFRDRRLKVLAARPAPHPRLEPEPGSELVPGALAGSTVATGDGWLTLDLVQPEGKKPMPADAWLSGLRLEPGERLE